MSGGDLWVFGYGSLIWKPGFPFLEQRRARLVGFHRALCVFSVHYRGTSRQPGLVFGLAAGGFCEGMVFRIAAGQVRATTDYLRDREQVTGVYKAERRLVELAHPGTERGGLGEVRALAFIANPYHPQYAGALPMEMQVRIVRAAHGVSGPNAEYVRNTARHLAELGIRDRDLALVAARLGRVTSRPAYPRDLVQGLPPQRALCSGYQRNLGL